MTSASVFDPVRRRHVPATPEEGVRQAVIRYLIDTLGVPVNLIGVEFSLASLDPGNLRRMDVVAWRPGRASRAAGAAEAEAPLVPWLLVECKAPGIRIDDAAAFQAADYLRKAPCAFVMLSNGKDTRCLERNGEGYRLVPSLPYFPR
jgi:hypothetical protein